MKVIPFGIGTMGRAVKKMLLESGHVGCERDIFPDDALAAVHELSQGALREVGAWPVPLFATQPAARRSSSTASSSSASASPSSASTDPRPGTQRTPSPR